ncbi:unnamed protein product [Ectocarpus sp. 6 AP-2014]
MVSGEDCPVLSSGPARKRPRPLEEAVETGDGVALKFSESFASDNQNLVLLQVPESLLNEIGEDADKGLVKLIGGEDEDAVLVTGGQTFTLTKAETSNTLLLVPPEAATANTGVAGGNGASESSGGCTGKGDGGGGAKGEGGFEAVAAVGFQFELSKKTPSLEQIRVILEACLYRGKAEEAATDRGRLEALTLAELQTRVQFSRRELLQGLKELDAVEIDGRWRMVDPALMERTADALLAAVVEEDIPLDKVGSKACIAALPDCEPLVLEHCLRTYSLPSDNAEEQNGAPSETAPAAADSVADQTVAPAYFRLDLAKVARLRAHQIMRAHEAEMNGGGGGGSSSLHGSGGPISLGEFMDRWAASMPGVDTPSQDLLKGIALVETRDAKGQDKNASLVSYVPASGLPFSPAERLAALFRIKPKWPMAELEPYISEADRKAGFLLKNTRASTDPGTGQKLFSAR